ncbi:MAG: MarC family protein [Polyangiales bacterium]
MDSALFWNFFIAAVAIVTPIGKVPIWVEASEGCDPPVRMRLAAMVTGTATALLLVFLFFGRSVLTFLGIDLPAFRVGGGIIILLLGIDMLRGNAVDLDAKSGRHGDDAFDKAKARFRDVVVPVAIPILAGPGSITTVLLFGVRADDWWERGALALVLCAVMAVVLLILLAGHRLQAILGELALRVQTRIWGLLLTGIAAQLILVGLGESFPNWLDASSPILDDVQQSADFD